MYKMCDVKNSLTVCMVLKIVTIPVSLAQFHQHIYVQGLIDRRVAVLTETVLIEHLIYKNYLKRDSIGKINVY